MVIVPYSHFGLEDPDTYRLYLLAFRDGVGRDFLVGRQGVQGGNVARVTTGGDGDRMLRETETIGAVDAIIARYIDGRARGGDCGFTIGGDDGFTAVRTSYVSRGTGDGDAGVGIGGGFACGGAGGGSSCADDLVEPGQEENSRVPKVGKWRKKNEKKKERRREKEASEVGGDAAKVEVSWRTPRARVVEKTEAQITLEAKWVVENKLKMAEARRKLQLLEMQDVSEVAKLQERKVKAAGERALVQIEKSHATLAATGNVPGVVPKGGYCTTVVDEPGLSDGSSPSCTISPDSSASMQELRELQKVNLDQEKKIADLEKLLSRREKAGRMNREDSVAEFTVNGSEVGLPASLCEVLDNKCGQYEYEGLCDGKHVVRAVRDLHFGFDEGEDAIGMFDSY